MLCCTFQRFISFSFSGVHHDFVVPPSAAPSSTTSASSSSLWASSTSSTTFGRTGPTFRRPWRHRRPPCRTSSGDLLPARKVGRARISGRNRVTLPKLGPRPWVCFVPPGSLQIRRIQADRMQAYQQSILLHLQQPSSQQPSQPVGADPCAGVGAGPTVPAAWCKCRVQNPAGLRPPLLLTRLGCLLPRRFPSRSHQSPLAALVATRIQLQAAQNETLQPRRTLSTSKRIV
jgi:hypothetical protein